MFLASAVGILILILSHIFVDKLKLTFVPRSIWLSTAGGISVSYIFVIILPELQEWQEQISEKESFLKHSLYLFSLAGLAIFYGLERAAKISGSSHRNTSSGETGKIHQFFWIHIFSFSIYNLLIGYLLIDRENKDLKNFSLFVIAMAFHFLVNDYGLLDHYREAYKNKGRWIITTAIVVGWIIGIFIEIPEMYIGIVFAFIAGAIILNVLKEELPEERKSNYWAFLLGIIVYSFLMLI